MKEAEPDNNPPVLSAIQELKSDMASLKLEVQELKVKIKTLEENIEKKLEEKNRVFEEKLKEENRLSSEKMREDYEQKFRHLEEKLRGEVLHKLENMGYKKLESEEEKRETSEVILKNVGISGKSMPIFSRETIKCGYLSLSNSNTTIEKIKGNNWTGILCTPVENPSSPSMFKQTFSIKIDKTQDACIMFGFCVKSAECEAAAFNEGVYWNTRFSFMLDLSSSYTYFRSSRSKYITTTNLKQVAINTQGVFSASIDLNKKTIKFYLDGKLLAPEIEIDLTPEEAEMMCPCVDIYDEGDRVSLVFQLIE